MNERLTHAIEDYLKAIAVLEESGERVTTSTIAGVVGVSAPSATAMVKRLATLGFLEHEPYRGVVLTEAGRKVALEIVRHHRLLERYLAEALGVPLDRVHEEADRLEHSLSEELEERIDEMLGHPTHDPHGHPIPDRELNFDRSPVRTLADLTPGDRATVCRVPDGDAALLRYLADLELVPGKGVELRDQAPFEGPVMLRSASGDHAISRELATTIGVD
jgi:DtxR family transcriptional regulator, Mn-dependent transcriptional regulator